MRLLRKLLEGEKVPQDPPQSLDGCLGGLWMFSVVLPGVGYFVSPNENSPNNKPVNHTTPNFRPAE